MAAAVALEAADDVRDRREARDFADLLAVHVIEKWGDCPDVDEARDQLLHQPFAFDPSISVREAAEVVSRALGSTLGVADFACMMHERPDRVGGDADRFPSEAAMRA